MSVLRRGISRRIAADVETIDQATGFIYVDAPEFTDPVVLMQLWTSAGTLTDIQLVEVWAHKDGCPSMGSVFEYQVIDEDGLEPVGAIDEVKFSWLMLERE